MKILKLGLEWFPEQGGGLDRVYYDCIQYLPKANINISGLVVGCDTVIQDSHGIVRAYAPPSSSLINRYFALKQATHDHLQQHDYDLVAAHFALYTWPILGQLGQIPLVFHFHGPWAMEGQAEGGKKLAVKFKDFIERRTYRRAASFIVLSQAFRDILHQQFQIPFEKIHIVPGGVEAAYFSIQDSQSEAREQLQWPSDRPILFCVRRLIHRMGLENLIEAILQVKQKFPEVLLMIAGKGPLGEQLQSQIDHLGLTNHVRLLGYVSDQDLKLCYRAADITIVPTVSLEGFGLIVIESLAAGTPVLGTPVGGIPEILRPLSSDLVLEGWDIKHLANGICESLTGDRQLPSSQSCISYARKNYSWPVIAGKIKEVYQKAIDMNK